MRSVWLALVLALVAIPAFAEDDKLWAIVDGCYEENWKTLDDGISDASTVARAVALKCATEFQQYLAANRQQVTPGTDGGAGDNALIAVLRLRAAAKAGGD